MAQFDVDFSESYRQLAEFQLRVMELGVDLDKMEGKAKKGATAASGLFREMAKAQADLGNRLKAVGVHADEIESILKSTQGFANKMMSGFAAANLKATAAQRAYNGEMAELKRLLEDTSSKNTFNAWSAKASQLTNKLTAENQYLRQAIQAAGTETGVMNTKLKATLATKQRLLAIDTKQILQAEELRSKLGALSTDQGRANLLTEEAIRAKRAESTETARLAAQIEALKRAQAGLNGGQQEQVVRLQASIAARRAEIVAATSQKKVVDEQTKALRREEAQLVRLQAQMAVTSSARGRQISAIREQIKEQERQNRLMGMTTSQLLGLGGAQQKVNVAQEVGSQSAAMLRAGLQGAHASVGMYTSSTILAATATYGLSAALRDSIITGAEFSAMMSRTEAVMSSTPEWMKTTTQANKAMEMQVRALGQATVFTASEVGEGLQQLGMAGFNSNQAMTALPATLTLANLANVSMARSADIATNVLMTFGMQAKDLTGVVDLMATAVNNSNTDIEQLANALSYAGPAAQTAGISLKDTVAAVEALANSGIKGSRAGSALRRLFVSLLNPTKKGAEVIRKYGLDIVDAEGKTRSLTSIIDQLSKALKAVPGPERLAAIQDLVGVYATSPIAALVDQNQNFQNFRDQNENTAGAGERMESIISDNLKFDWKEMLSALEEVQLQAFDSMGMKLRELVAGVTTSVLDLMEPVKTVGDIDITGLDRLMVQAQVSAEALARVVAGIVAYKFATGNVFGALASDAKGAAERLTLVADRAKVTSAGLLMMGSSSTGARTSVDALTSAHGRLTAAMGGAAAASSFLAGKLSVLAGAAGALMRGLGWVGLIYGIGSAIYEVFSSDTDEKVLEHKNSVDSVKSSYALLKQQIEETGLARQREAAKENVEAQKLSVGELQTAISQRQQQIKDAERLGVSPEGIAPFKEDLATLQKQLPDYEQRVRDAKDQLANLGTTTNDVTSVMGSHAEQLQNLITLTDQLTIARANLDSNNKKTGINDLRGKANVGRLQSEVDLARARLNNSATSVVATRTNIPTVASQFAKYDVEAQAAAQEAAYNKTATVSQKLLDIDIKRNEELATRQKLMDADDAARARGKPEEGPGLQIIEASNKRLLAIDKERLELQSKQSDQENTLRLAKEATLAASRNDQENILEFRKRLADIEKDITTGENPEKGKARDVEKLTGLYREQTQVRNQLNQLENKANKPGRTGPSQEVKDLEQAQRAYDQLVKKVDPLAAAQRDLAKGTEAMVLLRAADRITTEQQAKATGELNLAYHTQVKALDLLETALDKVRGSYNTSPFSSMVNDLATLNQALAKNKISLEDYARITDRMSEKQKESVKASLPKANLSVGEASSSPFTDWVATEMERAQGFSDYGKAMTNSKNNQADQMVGIEEEFNSRLEALNAQKLIEQGAEQAHIEKMLQIQTDYQAKKSSLMKVAGDEQAIIAQQQAKYAEQMGTMAMMSALGSVANVLGMVASASEDATTGQKIAFAAQKALVIAQILMYTHLAAAQAMTIPGDTTKVMGLSLAAFITATGYANAGLVGALAIGELAGGGKSGGSGGGTQMYDTGGFIPYNRMGIVGEYGPELVSGPTHVRGRGSSSGALNKGSSGGDMKITLAPVIQVTAPQGAATTAQDDARAMADMTKQVVMKQLQEAVRPNGMLDNWYRQKGGK